MARSKTTSRKNDPPPPPPPTWDERLINSLAPYRLELFGFLVAFVAILLALSLVTLPVDACPGVTICLFREAFGWGIYPLLLSVAAAGIHVALSKTTRPYHISSNQIIGLELILFTLLPISYIVKGTTLPQAHLGYGGGLFGWALSVPLLNFFGPLLTGLFYLAVLLFSICLITHYRWEQFLVDLTRLSAYLQQLAQRLAPDVPPTAVAAPINRRPTTAPLPEEAPPLPDTAVELPTHRDERLPTLDLLEKSINAPLSQDEVNSKKQLIEETLAHFGLPATITRIQQGPAVTQFGVEPGYLEKPGLDGEMKQQKVRIGQIAALQKDIALALAAQRLRIQAPVPGQGVVGIEVPNEEISMVRLRAILESEPFQALQTPLAVAIGRDVSGEAVAVDLAKMPHLLVAGTTGSGKSVCINALIACLVFNNTPEMLNLIMIDPKKVEMIRFNGLPHLIGQVEVEADRAVGVLRWLTAEMDRRYEMFSQLNARNLNGYNQKAGRTPDRPKLPHIVAFIDELADLMHTYPGDVERTLCRLAQMARATGIHLVVATQRPSTDVITGLIKANFPARLSFSVASSIDSRVILDAVGAEQLLGRGDMLFFPPDAAGPQRVQGVFMDDSEIDAIVAHWQQQLPTDYQPKPPPWENLIAKYALLDETDSLLEQAVELAQKYDNLSTSFLQRRLRIGFPRAARIMEHLYEMGLVEDPEEGGKTRRTTVGEDDHPLDDYIASHE